MTLADLGPVLLVGAGRMGGAMLDGWLGRGLDPALTTVLDPALPPEVEALIASRGVRHNPRDPGAPPPALLLLAVKPQVIHDVVPKVVPHVAPGTVVVSIVAGTTINTLASMLPPDTAIIRAMPNTPAAVGRGFSVCVAAPTTTQSHRQMTTALLEASGEVAWIDDESLMDAVTAVSGSGPAYVFWLTECLADAAVSAGLPSDLAGRLARATVTGAGELMNRSTLEPAKLRENVTSAGGTTAEALAVLMADDGLKPLMVKAVAAAKRRAGELGS